MNAMKKGLLVALVHVLLVCSLGAKLLYDRATRPRVWVQSFSYDPNLPIRGRYASLQAIVETDTLMNDWETVRLEVRNGRLYAVKDPDSTLRVTVMNPQTGRRRVGLMDSSLFFIPDTAKDPTWLKRGETLWFEATIPKKGPPRPIRLAISKADGSFTPLDLR